MARNMKSEFNIKWYNKNIIKNSIKIIQIYVLKEKKNNLIILRKF